MITIEVWLITIFCTNAAEACKMKYWRTLKPMKSLAIYFQECSLPKPGHCHTAVQTDELVVDSSLTIEDLVVIFQTKLQAAEKSVQIDIVQKLFDCCCCGIIPLTADYIRNSVKAMEHLKMARKPNVIAGVVWAFGTM